MHWYNPFSVGITHCCLLFSCSVVSDSVTPWTHARLPCPSLSPRVCSDSWPLSWWCHPIICCPLFLLPSVFPSIRVFSNESVLHIRWPKDWSFSFSFSNSPSNEYLGLISFRIDWFDLLPMNIQGSPRDYQESHNMKESVLWHSAFFIIQLSHPYMTIGKTIAFTIQTFLAF